MVQTKLDELEGPHCDDTRNDGECRGNYPRFAANPCQLKKRKAANSRIYGTQKVDGGCDRTSFTRSNVGNPIYENYRSPWAVDRQLQIDSDVTL